MTAPTERAERLLTRQEAAQALGMSVRTVDRLIAAGRLGSIKAAPSRSRSARRVAAASLRAFAESRGVSLPEWLRESKDAELDALRAANRAARERLLRLRAEVDHALSVLDAADAT